MIVIKRDGTKVKFDSEKIANAVDKAYREVYGEYDYNFSSIIAYSITYELLFGSEKTIEEISIEKIQDLVVKELKLKDKKVAEAYQQYREKRTRIRQSKCDVEAKLIQRNITKSWWPTRTRKNMNIRAAIVVRCKTGPWAYTSAPCMGCRFLSMTMVCAATKHLLTRLNNITHSTRKKHVCT